MGGTVSSPDKISFRRLRRPRPVEAIENETRFLRLLFVLHKPASSRFAMRRRMRKIVEGGMRDRLDFPIAQSLKRICDELAMCIEKL